MLNHLSSPVSARGTPTNARSKSIFFWLILLANLGAGLATAYLLVAGDWQVALALLFLLPGLIVIHRHPFLAVVLWLLVGPFLLHTTTGAERQVYWLLHRGLPPLAVMLVVVSSALDIRPRPLPRPGIPEAAMVGYLIFGALSIYLFSGTSQATFYLFYDRVFAPMCLYFLIRLTAPGEKEWQWLLLVFVFIVVSQSAVGVLSWVAPSVLPSKWLDKVGERTTGTLVNPSIYTTALLVAGLPLIHKATRARRASVRYGLVAAFLLCGFAVFISFSRASWLAGIVVVGGIGLLYPRLMLRVSLIAAVLSILVGSILLPPYIDKARQRLYSEEAQGSALDRLPGFLAAYRMFQEKPLIGWGYGNFDLYDRQFMGRVLDFANDNKDHASHNWFLSMLAEQGLIGSLLFFGPVGWWFLVTVRNWRRIPRGGELNRKLLALLWLIILSEVIINNFMNMIIFFGHGMWWIVLALIANILTRRRLPEPEVALRKNAVVVWKAAPYHP